MDGRSPRWRDIQVLATHAEKVGFDSLWVADTILVWPGTSEAMGY